MPVASLDVGLDGRVGVVWTSAHEDENLNVYFAESTDDGDSFGVNRRLHQITVGVQEDAAIAYDALGRIHTFWQTETTSWDYDLLYVYSDDGGVTLSEPERVTDDPVGSLYPQTEVAAVGLAAGGVLAVWMDTREAYDENIYFASSATTTAIAPAPLPGEGVGDGTAPSVERARIYPNPVRTDAWLRASSAHLYDVHGRLVRRLLAPAGSGERMHWDGRNARGERVAPGAYFVRLVTAGGEETRRIIVTR